MTWSAIARRSSRVAWAAIRARASSSVMPRWPVSLASWVSAGASTTTTRSYSGPSFFSASSGTS